MTKLVMTNRRMAAALVAVVLTWLAPVGAAHAQTVGIGRPGDHWASTLAWTHIGRGERNGAYGYKIKLRADDGCEVELFYPRSAIDFQGQGRSWQNLRVRVETGWLHYPSRLNARSLPKVHPGVLEVEDHYQRQADGAIAAAQGFALVATLGTLAPAPRAVPTPRTPRTQTPRVRSRTAPPRTAPSRTAQTQAAPARTPRTAPSSRANASRTTTSATTGANRFVAPKVFANRHGQLTNGRYVLDEAGMAPHTSGSLAKGKSQFLHRVNAKRLTLDTAAYADEAGLWVGNKAKVILDDFVGVHAGTGQRTQVLNIYRTNSGFIHAAPGTPL